MRPAWFLVLVLTACQPTACQPPQNASPSRAVAQPEPPAPAAVPVQRCAPGARACVGDDVVQCRADGTLSETVERCQGACRDGACAETCALQDVELIYVVDRANRLFSFDPRKLPADPLRLVGILDCDPRSTPNSMAVDRKGIAWLGYHDGQVFRASIVDGHCNKRGTRPRGAPATFGMGFVTDGPESTREKLWVAGGDEDPVRALAILDTELWTWNPVASLSSPVANPELTGTSEGRLFAYFPSPGRGFVQELDRTTAAATGPRWVIPGAPNRVEAYAFAHWGGVFYVFTTANGISSVHAVHRKSGEVELARDSLPYVIVGAGVSTCAPLLERMPE